MVLFVKFKYAIELYRCVDYTADTAAFVDDNNNDDGQMIRRGSQQYIIIEDVMVRFDACNYLIVRRGSSSAENASVVLHFSNQPIR